MSFLALTLAPIRVVAVFIVLFAANIVSIVGLIGISEADLRSKPLEGGDLFSKREVKLEVSSGLKSHYQSRNVAAWQKIQPFKT